MLGVNDKNAIVDRLMQIVTAESATVQTKNGPVEDEVTADKNSLTAAKSLGGLYVKFLKNRSGTAGLSASHDGFRIGKSFARCETENAGTVGVMLNVKDQNAILDRLMQILAKQTVTVQTKNGSVEDEVTADKNSIAAAKFMIGIQAKYLKHDNDDADIVRLNENDQKAIVERLMQILSKRSVIVQTKNGPVEDRVIADKNAITSANLLFALESGTAGSCASHDGLRIGKPLARCETENDAGTAGLRASHDGFKIGESFARCETEDACAASSSRSDTAGLCASGTAGSCASDDGFKVGNSLTRCESAEARSDAYLAVQDVLQTKTRTGTADGAGPHFRAGGEPITCPDKSNGVVAVKYF